MRAVFAVLGIIYAAHALGCAGSFRIELDEQLRQELCARLPDEPGPEPDPEPEPEPEPSACGPYQLCVDGEPYLVRGVNYGPQHEESCGSIPFYEAVAFDDVATDAGLIAAAGLNTIRTYTPLSRAISTGDCRGDGACWLDERHLRSLEDAGLRVIITVSSEQAFHLREHLGAAERYTSSPAVLALQLGNEMNHNSLYGSAPKTPSELVALANVWADEVRAAGWTKPVILGWGHPAQRHREVLRRSNADAIAYQLYERLSFRTSNGQSVFDWHRGTFDGSLAAKVPGLVTEYGADARNGDQLDEAAQAFAVGNLLELVEADAARPDGIAGGVIFSWADNWAKADGDPCVHGTSGKPGGSAGPHPDGIYHEEWWGLVRRDRTPRPAYYRVQEVLR